MSSESNKEYGHDRPTNSESLEQLWRRIHWFMKGQYDAEWKNKKALPLLQEMSDRGDLGDVVVDVGAGHSTLVRGLMKKHTVGIIDIVVPDARLEQHFAIQADLRHLNQPSRKTKRGLLEAARTLKERQKQTRVNTFVFSDILNYVDYKKLLNELNVVLVPGGRVVIINMPNLGPEKIMEPDDTRFKHNSELIEFLESKPPKGMGYTVEQPKHRDAEYLDNLKERLIIVTRKSL
jgi:ubiquinone/menaquinone biosynthesis C-methylase UbiE